MSVSFSLAYDSPPMKFQAVIFDMDGLMLDTERTYRDVFNRAAADCGIDFPMHLHESMIGRNSSDSRAILSEHWKDEALLARFFDAMRQHHHVCFQQPQQIKKGLHELLDFLEARNVPKIVATSTRREWAIPRLKQHDLLHRFADVSTGDQVERGKPAPDLFLLAASTINVEPSKCVVLEDSEAGVTGAHAAGMTVCMVPDMKQPCDEVRQRAHDVYESLVEVRHFLERELT